MLKEWFWWQIEAGFEHMDEDSCISLSDLTIGIWMALSLEGCMHWTADPERNDPERNDPERNDPGLSLAQPVFGSQPTGVCQWLS